MVRFIAKSVKIIKEGEGDGGHWISRGIQFQEAVKVFSQDGTEHNFTSGSTFDTMASAMQAGEVWEAEAEINGKYLNLKKLNKVGTPQTPAVAPPTPTLGTTTGKGQPPEINGAARGMAVNTVTALIVASSKDIKLLTAVFEDKAPAVMAWYKHQLLSIMEIK